MNRRRGAIFLVTLLMLVSLLAACGPRQVLPEKHTREFFALDTTLRLTAYGGKEAEEALRQAINRINEIEQHMSTTIPGSDIFQINLNAGKQPVKVHDDTLFVIEKALQYAKLSDGVFDITIFPIVELWGITTDHPRVPEKAEIEERLQLVDYHKVQINAQEKTVFLAKEGMGIDLGAIAKGYAGDEAARIFRDLGIRNGLINMGGNVVVVGDKPGGHPWRIAIRDPRGTANDQLADLAAVDQAIVSSGDYERYIKEEFERTGIRYHHIFDPRTGFPATTGLMATTIFTNSSIDADALSTIVFILGAEKGLRFAERFSGVQALVVTTDKKVMGTPGFLETLHNKNKEYRFLP